MNTTIENNKLIAEFIGGKRTVNGTEYTVTVDGETEFNKSFDLLFKVVEKIESLGFSTSIYHLPKTLNTAKIISGGVDVIGVNGSTKIEAVYNAVVEFINWYNSARKKIKNERIYRSTKQSNKPT